MLRRRIETFLIALGGTAVFYLADLPLPFLFGPMFACLLAALSQRELEGFGTVSVLARATLGVTVGSTLTPEILGQLPQMAASLVFVPIYIILIGAVGLPFFERVCGFDRVTAWYAAMPGGLQDMVLFGKEAGGDPRALSLIHATRVLIIVTLAPAILTFAFGATVRGSFGPPATDVAAFDLALMAATAVIGWQGAKRIGLFGASILGPLILAAILSMSGLLTARPPGEAILFAQFMIGIEIGVGYVGVTLRELQRDILAGVAYVVVLAVLATGITLAVLGLGLAPPVAGFLAFAPGGQAEMTLLAIVAGADLGYVIVHHLARIFLVITGAPIVARLVLRDRT